MDIYKDEKSMKAELKKIISDEKSIYLPHITTLKEYWSIRITHDESYEIFRWSCALRCAEYYGKQKQKSRNVWNRVLFLYYYRKMNILGGQLGYFVSTNVLGKSVKIFHRGNIIINYRSVIGEGCKFHGDNCVGNNGENIECPVLGKNVDVGIGAKIIGGVTIADNIKIGANAVVTKSFTEPGITIAGVPAKKIKE